MTNELKDGKQIISVEGELNALKGEELKNHIVSLFPTSDIFVVSFSNVVYLNSSGLRELIDLLKTAKKSGKEIRLCEMLKDIRSMFTMTGLEKVFKIYDNKTKAIE